jgi:Protein of unknown function (DUF3037)
MTESGYSVIRYIPDAARGESLNIGVLVWAVDDFRLHIDQKAVDRVIKENPRLATDALLYVEPMLTEQLSTGVVALPSRINTLLTDPHRFPLVFSEPRFTAIDLDRGRRWAGRDVGAAHEAGRASQAAAWTERPQPDRAFG